MGEGEDFPEVAVRKDLARKTNLSLNIQEPAMLLDPQPVRASVALALCRFSDPA
jgi:hypothetical protein